MRLKNILVASLLSLTLTRCTYEPAAVASKEFQPAPSPVIQRPGYVLAYEGRIRHASWVYEELTAESLKGETERAEFDFMEDPLIPAHLRASKSDYRRSGFDRGHLSPAANARSSPQTMKDTFYLSNISPQHPQLNRKYWVKLERHVREMTKTYAKVYVITGPLFIPEMDKEDGNKYVRYQVIGENNVAVPTHYFKVIYGKKDNTVVTEAYVIPNQPIDKDPPLKKFAVTLDKVEKAAGLTFKNTAQKS
jgi:endonuclease G